MLDTTEMLVVAGALIRDGLVLCARRSITSADAGGWEFPGGKVDLGEPTAQALVREWREELGVEIEAVRELGVAIEGELELRLWLARLVQGEPAALDDHDELRWLDRAGLAALAWLPIDRSLLGVVAELLD